MFYTLILTFVWRRKKNTKTKKNEKKTNHIHIAHTQLHTDKNTPQYILLYLHEKLINEESGEMIVCDSTLYLLHFISWVSNLLSDLAIIVSIRKQCLILELRTLMEGECLFCLQEYRYCFSSSKIWFPNISSSHSIIPNSISLPFTYSFLGRHEKLSVGIVWSYPLTTYSLTIHAPWCCFMSGLHSISDVLSVSVSHLSYNFPWGVLYGSRVVSVRSLLSPSNVNFVSVINTENKEKATSVVTVTAWRQLTRLCNKSSLIGE